MKYVFILEKDQKFQKDIVTALEKVDPQLQTRIFTSLENFANWIQIFSKEGTKAIAKGGDTVGDVPGEANDQLALIICQNEIMGSKHIPLFRKTQLMCIQKNACTKEDPTPFVITAFDSPDFDLDIVEDRIISNVLFKPFDELILRQHLIFAISGRHPPSEYTIHNMKTSAQIEMIKDVNIEAYSELGFVTRSHRDIQLGKVAKYYGDVFNTGKAKSIFAKVHKCEPHPEVKGDFRCSFSFFGMTTDQISSLRKNIAHLHEQEFEYNWKQTAQHTQVNVIMVDEDEWGPTAFGETLSRNFENLNITKFKSYGELLFAIDPSLKLKSLKKVAAFPVPVRFKIFFDEHLKFVKTDPELKEVDTVLGYKKERLIQLYAKELVETDFASSLTEMVKGNFKGADPVLVSKHAESEFYIKFDGQQTLKDDKGRTVYELSLSELTEAERDTWIRKQSTIPEVIHAVLVNSRWISEDLSNWVNVETMLRDRIAQVEIRNQHQIRFFSLSKEKRSEAEMRNQGSLFSDILYKPIDRNYLIKKIHFYFPYLKMADPIEIKTFPKVEVIQVANPVPVEELSEAGLVMSYYRPITIGAFRKFAFTLAVETDLPVIHSTCNFYQEIDGDEKKYQHHFVFFGIRDEQLKQIRLWIRDNYIQSKEKG